MVSVFYFNEIGCAIRRSILPTTQLQAFFLGFFLGDFLNFFLALFDPSTVFGAMVSYGVLGIADEDLGFTAQGEQADNGCGND